MFRKKVLGVVAGAALVVAMTAFPAHGDLVVTGGPLGFDGTTPTVPDFTAITLTGVPQLTSLTIVPFTVADATGSAAGWHVLVTIPDLVNGTDTIAASNVSMTAPQVTAVGTSSMTGVAGHDSAGGFDTGEKIVDASATNGMGMYLVSPRPAKLTVPVTALAGTYTSAGTIAVVSGP
jgi:hypothetical protein